MKDTLNYYITLEKIKEIKISEAKRLQALLDKPKSEVMQR